MRKQILGSLFILSLFMTTCSSSDDNNLPNTTSDLLIVNSNISPQILRIYKNGASQLVGDINQPVHVVEGDVINIQSTEPAIHSSFWIKVTVGTATLVSHYDSPYEAYMNYTFTVHL